MLNQEPDKCHVGPSAEAEPFARFEFNVQRPDGTITIHLAECGLDTAIHGLKTDLKSVFNIDPDSQMWYLRSRILEDDKTLSCYGITGNETASSTGINIFVKTV